MNAAQGLINKELVLIGKTVELLKHEKAIHLSIIKKLKCNPKLVIEGNGLALLRIISAY